MSIPAYDLIDITVGRFKSTARPIEWDGKDEDGVGNDANGRPINAVMYMTTCPACGQLIQFKSDDLYQSVNDQNNVKCQHCGTGNDRMPTPDEIHDLIVILDDETISESDKLVIPHKAFVDPILSGEFDIPIDVEKLNELG